jgi:hypothetical protein
VHGFLNALVGYIPAGLQITVQATGDIIMDTDGSLAGTWGEAPVAVVQGSSAGNYTGASGAVVHWLSSGVVRGRRVRGRTFLVPLGPNAYDVGSGLTTAAITAIKNAADGLVTAGGGGFVAWSRPAGFSAGSSHAVTGTRVPDLAAVLRSRRM